MIFLTKLRYVRSKWKTLNIAMKKIIRASRMGEKVMYIDCKHENKNLTVGRLNDRSFTSILFVKICFIKI